MEVKRLCPECKRPFRAPLSDTKALRLVTLFKVTEKLQQPNPGRMAKGTDPSRMKLYATTPGKEPRTIQVLAEGGGNIE